MASKTNTKPTQQARKAFTEHVAAGRYAKALAEAQSIENLDAERHIPLGMAAHASYFLQRYDQAIDYAERALAIEPGDHYASFWLITTAVRRQDWARVKDQWAATRAALEANDWKGGRQSLSQILSNVIIAYVSTREYEAGRLLLERDLERGTAADLAFNASCLYAYVVEESRAGRGGLSEAEAAGRLAQHMREALLAGKTVAEFEKEADFDRVRDLHPFQALLALDWDWERQKVELIAFDHHVHGQSLVPWKDEALATEPLASARYPRLEDEIRTHVDDPRDAALVYSDWLQERGDVRGELMALDARIQRAHGLEHIDDIKGIRIGKRAGAAALLDDLRERALFVAAHRHALFGDLAPYMRRPDYGDDCARMTWRYGLVDHLYFDVGYSRRNGSTDDAAEVLAAILGLPVCRFLRRLTVGDLWADDMLSLTPAVDVVNRQHLPTLQALRIEPTDFQMSWTDLSVRGLSAAQPQLVELTVGAGELDIEPFALPALRVLRVHSGGLDGNTLDRVLASIAPKLEELELWFGSEEYGSDVEPGHLDRLLAGGLFPGLRRLGLMNASFTDELCEALADASVLRRLTHLDLGMGTMTSAGAQALARRADRFAHLEALAVSNNCLSDDDLELLRQLPCTVVSDGQKSPDERYVSVAE